MGRSTYRGRSEALGAVLTFLALVLFFAAASPAPALQRSPSFETRDSAGVRIVISAHPDTTLRPIWQVSNTPEVSIGEMEGPEQYLFDRVTDVLRLADGTLIVANAGGTELRFYDSGGRHERTVGRDGDGPGEFRYISSLRQLSTGEILVADDRAKRVTLLAADGPVVRMWRFSGLNVGGALSDGVLVGRTGDGWSPQERGGGLSETTTTLVAFDNERGRSDTIASLPGVRWWADRSNSGRASVRALPWSTSTEYATGPDKVVVGWTGAPRVQVHDESGRLVRVLEWSYRSDAVSAGDIEALVQGQPEGSRPAFRRSLREMPLPNTKPVFRKLLLDDKGNIWVGLYEPRVDGSQRWLVFNRGGVAAGYVDTPARFRVHSVQDARAVGVAFDEWGLPRIAVFRLLE